MSGLPYPSDQSIERVDSLERLEELINKCERCPLHKSRLNPVPGEGAPDARLFFVGEAPGKNEDETGRPFVGRAGSVLNDLLAEHGWKRSEVFIANVLKSRPPNNRDPKASEARACFPYLERQVELVDPDVIVALGLQATQTLLDRSDTLTSFRAENDLSYCGVPLVPTYHPAALLRNPNWREPTLEDFKRIQGLLEQV